MNVYIDIHTHNPQPDNPFAVVNLNIEMAGHFLENSPDGYCSVGIHPWDVHRTDSSVFQQFEKLAQHPKVVAIGECGLDKNSTATISEQNYFFERQIRLSEEVEKPLIIHSVATFNEIIAMKKRHKPQQVWIIHGFRGKPETAKQLLNHGFMLSYGEKFNPLSVEITPVERLCVETDESSLDISEIYKKIAAIKSRHTNELNAACRLLKLYIC